LIRDYFRGQKISSQNLYCMTKKVLRCHKCSAPLHFEKTRNWFGRNILFFLPLHKYFCAKCLKNRYVWISKSELKKYH